MQTRLGPLDAVHVVPEGERRGPPVLLLHGIGLGAWFWERDQHLLAAQGLESWAVDLPGHGSDAGQNRSLDEIIEGALGAVDALEKPAVVGHSMGGIVAQTLSGSRDLSSIVLVSSLAPRAVRMVPTKTALRIAAQLLPAFLAGKNLRLSLKNYRDAGLHLLPEHQQEACFSRIVPWPNRATRGLVRRPDLPPASCPCLVTFGLQDKTSAVSVYRLLGDYHDAITWRFDNLAHMPPVEPGGERHAEAIAGWILQPRGRIVTEVDPLAPQEGIGEEGRRSRMPGGPRSDSPFRKRRKDRD